jgi:hypothetical protein
MLGVSRVTLYRWLGHGFITGEQVLERARLQRLLRARIDAIADDVLIVAEEFGAFADAKRRIDLLGIDREGRLVVFELKRTLDGGHLELQALRYAAMISTMTFDDLVVHYENHLTAPTGARSDGVGSSRTLAWPVPSAPRTHNRPHRGAGDDRWAGPALAPET